MEKSMKDILQDIDLNIKILYLKLVNYQKNSNSYNKTLDAINHLYQSFNILLLLERYDKEYEVIYSDLNEIRNLLIEEGYIEQPKSK